MFVTGILQDMNLLCQLCDDTSASVAQQMKKCVLKFKVHLAILLFRRILWCVGICNGGPCPIAPPGQLPFGAAFKYQECLQQMAHLLQYKSAQSSSNTIALAAKCQSTMQSAQNTCTPLCGGILHRTPCAGTGASSEGSFMFSLT